MSRSHAGNARGFLRWWIAELKGLMPAALHSPLRRSQRRLVLSVEGAHFRAVAERGSQIETLAPDGKEQDLAAALQSLAEAARAQPGIPLGIRLTREDCFSRLVQLPAAAERDFGSILDLDLERSTPFRREDVLTAHYVDPAAAAEPGKRAVRHVVVKRARLEPLARQVAELGIAPSFIDCWSKTRERALPLDFLSERSRPATGAAPWLAPALATAATVLAMSALAIFIVRQQSTLAELDAQIAQTRQVAETVRQALESAQSAAARIETLERLSHDRISALRVLDELSAILPDNAWVYDLRLDAGAIEMTGFARSAAALIPLFEHSPTFTGAALTAPVVFDGPEDRERFTLRVQLRGEPQASADEQPQGDL